jgi:sugar/nucleoside kinase (ribokinase family)
LHRRVAADRRRRVAGAAPRRSQDRNHGLDFGARPALVTYPGAIAGFLQNGLRPGLKNRFAAARSAGLTTSLDTGYDLSEQWSPELLDTLTEVDVLLPNEVEIKGITGCQ